MFRRKHRVPAGTEVSILFVCMGNICRSPTAEAVFRHQVSEAALDARLHVDSAGTHAYHVGKSPDARAMATAEARGISMAGQRARRVTEQDFHQFDFIVAMDHDNLEILQSMQPETGKATLSLMLDHHPEPPFPEVPDPYYGGTQGFEQVFDLVTEASEGLLGQVRDQLDADREPSEAD